MMAARTTRKMLPTHLPKVQKMLRELHWQLNECGFSFTLIRFKQHCNEQMSSCRLLRYKIGFHCSIYKKIRQIRLQFSRANNILMHRTKQRNNHPVLSQIKRSTKFVTICFRSLFVGIVTNDACNLVPLNCNLLHEITKKKFNPNNVDWFPQKMKGVYYFSIGPKYSWKIQSLQEGSARSSCCCHYYNSSLTWFHSMPVHNLQLMVYPSLIP